MDYQQALNEVARQDSEQVDSLYATIKEFDGDMAVQGVPSYTQLRNSLEQAVRTIDILLKAYDPGANREHFAAIARLDLADIERKLGNLLNH